MKSMLSKRAIALKPSSTLAVNRMANEMKARGEKVLNLSVGEPDFDTPQFIKNAAMHALQEGFTKYTDSSGIRELREAICNKFAKDNGLRYAADQVVVSCGAKHCLFNILLAICDDGDEVIIPAPYWVSYPEMVRLAGGMPIICDFNESYKIDPPNLKRLIGKKTKALILNSPSNPTGIVYTKEELSAIGKIVLETGILCISDEVYEKLVYGDAEHVSIASLHPQLMEQTITVNGVSKTYSMTGWRIGYLAAPADIAKAIANIQSQTTSNPTSFAQKAALAALTGPIEEVSRMVAEFERRRNYLLDNLSPLIKYAKPYGAFYLFLKIGNMPSSELARKLLEEEKLATVPGNDFGAEGYVRISFATSMDNIKETVLRLNRFAERQK
jgi:aspartate aminotransferase